MVDRSEAESAIDGWVFLGSARGSRALFGGLAKKPLVNIASVSDEAVGDGTRPACASQNLREVTPRLQVSIWLPKISGIFVDNFVVLD
jgi:hypothetical protein